MTEFKVIGLVVASRFRPERSGTRDGEAATDDGRRSFRCLHCKVVYVEAVAGVSLQDEAKEAFAHQALCDRRPAGHPLSDRELSALEYVYGTWIRESIALVEHDAAHGLTAADRARAIERRGVLLAELVRIGLPEDKISGDSYRD
jgi:hypothetical protein